MVSEFANPCNPAPIAAAALAGAVGLLCGLAPSTIAAQDLASRESRQDHSRIIREAQTVSADALRSISEPGSTSQDPMVVAKGARIAVVWVAGRGEDAAIQLAQRSESDWLPPQTVSVLDAGMPGEPALAFDDDGLAAVAYVLGDLRGSQIVLWREGLGDQIIAATPERMETPALQFSNDGSPLVSWVEGSAGDCRVMAARWGDGGWVHRELSESGATYDILPNIMGTETSSVFWYSLEDLGFSLRSAQFLPSGTIDRSTADARLLAPPDRLPILAPPHGDDVLGAVWMEPMSDGEIILYLSDSERGASTTIEPLPRTGLGVRQVEPAAERLPDGSMAYAWREESRDGARVAVLDGDRFLVVDGLVEPVQPRLAASREAGLNLVMISSARDGGDGQVYTLRLD